jgi:hypothetical protein
VASWPGISARIRFVEVGTFPHSAIWVPDLRTYSRPDCLKSAHVLSRASHLLQKSISSMFHANQDAELEVRKKNDL